MHCCTALNKLQIDLLMFLPHILAMLIFLDTGNRAVEWKSRPLRFFHIDLHGRSPRQQKGMRHAGHSCRRCASVSRAPMSARAIRSIAILLRTCRERTYEITRSTSVDVFSYAK
jgi:hypothetical protein